MNPVDICGWNVMALSCLRKVKSDDASIIKACVRCPGWVGGGTIIIKPPGNAAELFSEVVLVKLFN